MFRDDLGQHAEPEDLEALSGKQRRIRLDAIRTACQTYIQGEFMAQLRAQATASIAQGFRLELDPDDADDADGQACCCGSQPSGETAGDRMASVSGQMRARAR